jgi:hypothetical protein
MKKNKLKNDLKNVDLKKKTKFDIKKQIIRDEIEKQFQLRKG